MDHAYISENEFHEQWGARIRPNGELFEFDDVKDAPLHHVWTVVESGDDEDGSWYAVPGFHVVNKLGYVLTDVPWVDETLDAIYFLDDFEDDDDCDESVDDDLRQS